MAASTSSSASWLADLTTKNGEAVELSALSGKAVALYFSAHWCPPCKRFTPILKDLYEEVNEDDAKFEVVFVSSDDSAALAKEYMEEMHGDWLMISYDSPVREALKQKFGCFAGKEQGKFPSSERRNGIPALVVVGQDGSELCFNGTSAVEGKGPAAVADWAAW
eukprot:CAMPEP_0119478674 /NCGR_PEP_ID=MMETSP1344-20130328/8305_1 /TAXON_ID=236787 /ORGANISM="Florenciella parvula, Strain CCMP2471" /LENGTH=163 /DNA_ID=CAMNT_0007512865 /DNA_START=36 /DNA_END=527 /DNA_ORIENTATION=+